MDRELKKTVERIGIALEKKPADFDALADLFEAVKIIGKTDMVEARAINKTVRKVSGDMLRAGKGDDKYYYMQRYSLQFDAKDELDAYLQFLEMERDPKSRFYLPRRAIIRPIVNALQDLSDGVLELLSLSMPPGTGKTTLGSMYVTWEMGKHPELSNLISAHSDTLTRNIYDGICPIILDKDEYLWQSLFQGVKIIGTNAKDETLDLGSAKKFKTVTCRSIDGSLTGATRAENLLYSDDLVSSSEQALSIDRLDGLWRKYGTDLKSRKKENTKELHIATRWSVHDIIGRLERIYEGNPKARFLTFPALDDDEESNFNYKYGVGFSTKTFKDLRETMDEVSWNALYMNQPIEREGLLFPSDQLRYFNGVLPPESALTRKVAAVDIAWGGGDSLSMPIGYKYDDDVYIVDWIFNKGDKKVTKPIVLGKLLNHVPHQVFMEANNGGDEYCDDISKQVRERGVVMNIQHRKSGNATKMSRIIQAAPDIKNFIFLDPKLQTGEYRLAMKELTTFLQTGTSKHDDAPDSLAILAKHINSNYGEVKIIKRPF